MVDLKRYDLWFVTEINTSTVRRRYDRSLRMRDASLRRCRVRRVGRQCRVQAGCQNA